ncbi:unnamed protein product, partial [marine sediment metagenome]
MVAARDFDGATDYVELSDIALTDFTMAAWVKLDTLPTGTSPTDASFKMI